LAIIQYLEQLLQPEEAERGGLPLIKQVGLGGREEAVLVEADIPVVQELLDKVILAELEPPVVEPVVAVLVLLV
jgi:hypothetical protein